MDRDNLYLPAGISTILSALVTLLIIMQLISGFADHCPLRLIIICGIIAGLLAICNAIITFSGYGGTLTFFLPLILLAGMILALVITSWQTSIVFLISMCLIGIVITVINGINYNDFMLY